MLCILQARISSQRLPGKVLFDLKGRVLLGRVIDRVLQAKKVSKLIVATSDQQSDHPIVQFCLREGIRYACGSLVNVADRFRQIAKKERADAFVRISGDSPLLDPALIDQAIGYFAHGNWDLVTNILTRTFPKGQSVEVIRSGTFSKICKTLVTNDQREHVTKAFYENLQAFQIFSFTSDTDLSHVNLCIDTREDLTKIGMVLDRVQNHPGGWQELATIYQSLMPCQKFC